MRLIILVNQFLNSCKRYRPCLFLFLTVFFISRQIDCQLLTQEWIQRFNGSGNYIDQINAMTVDGSGNVYVTGQSYGSGTGYDYCTIKYNTTGVQQWVAIYDGPAHMTDIAYAIAVDVSGNVYVTGSSQHAYGAQNEDIATIKYNSSGVEQWVKIYNGASNGPDEGTGIAVDISGNVYVCGYTYDIITNYNFVTIKYNSSGIQQWTAIYDGPASGGDEATYIALDNLNNVYVTGNSHGINTANDYATIKYSQSGTQSWVARYDGPASGDDVPYCLAIDGAYNVIVTGRSPGVGTDGDFATVKYNSNGTQLWVQRFNGPGNNNDVARKVIVDGSNNIFVTGSATGISSGYDYCTIRYTPSGVQQWVAFYDGPASGSDEAFAIGIDGSGNIYVGGYSYGISSGADFCIVKYNQGGVQQSVTRYNGPGNAGDYLTSMYVTSNGVVYAAGYSQGIGTNYDYTTIKYDPVVGIKPTSNNVPDKFELNQNYPNPFNPSTHIGFQIVEPGLVSLKIYDILGREIATLVNEIFQSGSYEVEWNGSNFTSGVYFYKIYVNDLTNTSKDFISVRKMMLVK